MKNNIRGVVIIFLLVFLSSVAKGGVIKLYTPEQLECPASLDSIMEYLEVSNKSISISEITNSANFQSKSQFKEHYWNSTYWCRFMVENNTSEELYYSLSFSNLTYVDLFEFKGDSLYKKHLAGIFRSEKDITQHDESDHFNLKINAGEKVSCYLKIIHCKGYKPELSFIIEDHNTFHDNKRSTERFKYLIFGAFIMFFFYSLINYLFNRYSPYLWLSLFLLGITLYSFNLSGYFFSFFPNNPQLIWRFNNLFTMISSIGGILLISDFFNLKKNSPKGYSLLNILIIVEVVQFVLGQLIIELFSNYWWLTVFVIFISFFTLSAVIIISIKVRGLLTSPQKMFSYAIFFYAVFVIIGFLYLLIKKESSLSIISALGNLASVITLIFFSISLSEQMRAIVVERNLVLLELNQLKNEQNKILDDLVNIRTKELRAANDELILGREELLQRNQRIELLLRELHHRVKNNLQLISSFYDLRHDDTGKKSLREIATEGQNRIHIMALVHDMLYHGNYQDSIDFESFISQIAIHLQSVFNVSNKINTKIETDNIHFDMDTAIPLGLILNELLTNSFKHAHPGNGELTISISISSIENHLFLLTVSDNGKELNSENVNRKTQSFGLRLIYLLSKQLNGNFSYKYDGRNNFIVKFMDSEGRKMIL